LLAFLLAGVAVAFIVTRPSTPDPEALKADWLGRSASVMQLKLHSGQIGDPFLNGTERDYLLLQSMPRSHIDEPDGRSFDLYLRPDLSPLFQLEYYPVGPSGAMLKHGTKFADDGHTPVAEIAFRPNAKREMTGARMANGDYRSCTYTEDGQNYLSETFVGHGPEIYNPAPLLLRQTKWTEGNKLSYTYVLNPDSSQTTTIYDDDEAPIQISQVFPSVVGSSVVGYYPGTKVLRVQSKTTSYDETPVDYFRPDGTLSMHLTINAGYLGFAFFDSTGKHKTLVQHWYFDREVVAGITRMKNFRLDIVEEMDANGDPLRSWDLKLNTNEAWSTAQFNVDVAGEHWKEVHYFYSLDGFLIRVSYIGADDAIKKMEEHTTAEGLRPTVPPANLMLLTPVNDTFAIPVPQYTGHP
jgi:hypothetical protein